MVKLARLSQLTRIVVDGLKQENFLMMASLFKEVLILIVALLSCSQDKEEGKEIFAVEINPAVVEAEVVAVETVMI